MGESRAHPLMERHRERPKTPTNSQQLGGDTRIEESWFGNEIGIRLDESVDSQDKKSGRKAQDTKRVASEKEAKKQQNNDHEIARNTWRSRSTVVMLIRFYFHLVWTENAPLVFHFLLLLLFFIFTYERNIDGWLP